MAYSTTTGSSVPHGTRSHRLFIRMARMPYCCPSLTCMLVADSRLTLCMALLHFLMTRVALGAATARLHYTRLPLPFGTLW